MRSRFASQQQQSRPGELRPGNLRFGNNNNTNNNQRNGRQPNFYSDRDLPESNNPKYRFGQRGPEKGPPELLLKRIREQKKNSENKIGKSQPGLENMVKNQVNNVLNSTLFGNGGVIERIQKDQKDLDNKITQIRDENNK